MSGQALQVERLGVSFGGRDGPRQVVREVSFTIPPGRTVALVGGSGSGKSVTARSLVGLAGPGAAVSAARLNYGGRDLLSLSEAGWRAVRGREIGFVLQDALVSLDPLRPVGDEIVEAMRVHGWGNRVTRHQRMLDLLARVRVPEPELRARQRPGELSGGLRQRALIASALALEPGLVIADEPTTALDAGVQAQVVALLREIRSRGTSLLVISHDLGLVARLADEVVVLQDGGVVEQGPVRRILEQPSHPYTRALLGAGRRGSRAAARAQLGAPLLIADRLDKRFVGPDHQARLAVDGVSFSLQRGQTIGIVGESGSGKTTLARLALGLEQPDGGEVRLPDMLWASSTRRVPERRRRGRRREIGVIWQDPLSSFDPRWTVGRILADALTAAGLPRAAHEARVAELLRQVQLAAGLADEHPARLSGGQRQRVAIARAVASRPRIIVCDEPVSALDAQVQGQVLDLLSGLQREFGLAYLFISHDLRVIRQMSDEVMVMQRGQVVERGPTGTVFGHPAHPFTRQLLEAASLL